MRAREQSSLGIQDDCGGTGVRRRGYVGHEQGKKWQARPYILSSDRGKLGRTRQWVEKGEGEVWILRTALRRPTLTKNRLGCYYNTFERERSTFIPKIRF